MLKACNNYYCEQNLKTFRPFYDVATSEVRPRRNKALIL